MRRGEAKRDLCLIAAPVALRNCARTHTHAFDSAPQPLRPPLRHQAGLGRRDTALCTSAELYSLNTRFAFSRKNFGQTSSLKPTWGISEKIRSSDRPMGK